jgi:hypothetical protein
VGQCVDTGRRHVRVVDEVERGIEPRRRIASLPPAAEMVVLERVQAGGSHILIDREIGGCVEEGVRIAPLVPPAALK